MVVPIYADKYPDLWKFTFKLNTSNKEDFMPGTNYKMGEHHLTL